MRELNQLEFVVQCADGGICLKLRLPVPGRCNWAAHMQMCVLKFWHALLTDELGGTNSLIVAFNVRHHVFCPHFLHNC